MAILSVTKPTLINDFPRFVGTPHQSVVFNETQYREFVRSWIKMSDLYISVYKFLQVDLESGEPDRLSCWVDKIFFDFDTDDWLSDLLKVHDWCERNDIIHRCHFSGRGGHAFVFCSPLVKHKKESVANFQRWLCNEIGVTIDHKIVGDTSRIFRVPNSWHFKARRFCIPISNRILNDLLTVDILIELARTQQFVDPWCGSNLLDLSPWDKPRYLYMEDQVIEFNLQEIDDMARTDYPEFPPCVQSWLSTPDLPDYGKFLLVTFLRDQTIIDDAFDAQSIISILRMSLSPGEFDHYFGNGLGNLPRRHHGHRGIKFKRSMERDYWLPPCSTIRRRGYCPGYCGRRHPIYD